MIRSRILAAGGYLPADLVTNDADWADWSQRQLEAAAVRGPVLINDVVYAEFSVGFLRLEEVEALLSAAQIEVTGMPREALFLAGKVFCATGLVAAPARGCCLTSLSARMPPWRSCRC